MKTSLSDLMTHSGVGFGTSGARGLVEAMTDRVCYAYTLGFLQYLASNGGLPQQGARVAVAGDLRASTVRIMEAVCRAAEASGVRPVVCGEIPSPAVALYGLDQCIPSIMVTGSHIPDDRNGIKFNTSSGEILKPDEQGIAEQVVELDDALFDADGRFRAPAPQRRRSSPDAHDAYLARYLDFFDRDALRGLRVGVYQHSTVVRDLLTRILRELGADTVALGRSETFIPVDTEAIRAEDVQLAQQWAREERLDAIVSADGDGDRPLIGDEQGRWLRGDIAGILCARFLQADAVCTPISSNTALDRSAWFKQIRRTRIGSPYVIGAMIEATRAGARRAVGYEANGGFLIDSDIEIDGKRLRALPTRDAAIVILSLLVLAQRERRAISRLADDLPARFTASDRLKDFAPQRSAAILARFDTGTDAADRQAIERTFAGLCGTVANLDRTDGLRAQFANDEIVHLRPSGNAPEFRCYTEAASDERAQALNRSVLELLRAESG